MTNSFVAAGEEATMDSEDVAPSAARLAAVHVVTEEEAAAGTHRIEDVVLPLVGRDMTLPAHSTAQVLL